VSYSEEDERAAHIENMQADTEYKRGLLKYEPWKIVVTAMGAGAALTLAIIALFTFLGHR
jgi:formate/nitrite transporter FocA (FNT family)